MIKYLSFIGNAIFGCQNIKIYIKMKKNQPLEKRSSIQELLFTVHIVSAKLEKQYTHDYILYFQKNLQILGRYQMSPKLLKKGQKFYFQMPNSIEHFRIHNDKNLEFKWTLYIQRSSGNYQHEQYMQSKKALLKWCWDVYQQTQQKIHSVEVIFTAVKLTFNYIFIIGKDNQSIVKSIRQYYDRNQIIPSRISKLLKTSKPHLDLPPLGVQKSLSYIGLKQQQSFQQLHNKQSVTYPIKIPHQYLINQAKQKIQEKSNIIEKSEENHSILSPIPSLSQIPSKSGQNKDIFAITTSQFQIVKDIEERIKQSDEIIEIGVQGSNNQNHLRYQSKFIRDQVFVIKNITSSQYFNQKGEIVIQPFYLYYKYWFIIFGVLLIFYGLLHLGPKPPKISKNNHYHDDHHPHQQHPAHKHKKKSKQHQHKKSDKNKNYSKRGKK